MSQEESSQLSAVEQEELEAYLHSCIDSGELLWSVYPPGERMLADYRAWKASNSLEKG